MPFCSVADPPHETLKVELNSLNLGNYVLHRTKYPHVTCRALCETEFQIHTYIIVLSIFAAITLIADDATAGVHFSVKILQPP